MIAAFTFFIGKKMMPMILENIKTLLGIRDSLQDEILNILINSVSSHLKIILGREIPEELNYIVQDVVIKRYNRLGSEGMKSESVEGHSVVFGDLDKDFAAYQDVINKYKTDTGVTGRGKVKFI